MVTIPAIYHLPHRDVIIIAVTSFSPDSLNLAIPKSGSPIQSRKASSHHSPRKSGKTDSLRNSLNASINSRSQQDVSLRQSVEDTEVKLDEQVYHLATLTRDERPKARNDSDMLAYYRKLEGLS